MELRHPIPEWVTRGKTIRQLIEELQSFSDQDAEIRISLDYGETNFAVSIIDQYEDTYCVLVNAESYYRNGWQDFMDREGGTVEQGNGEDNGHVKIPEAN